MSEDLIRRSDAIDALKNALCELGGDEWGDGELGVHADDIDAVINDIPSIEPKRGKWVRSINNYDQAYHNYCSLCREWNGLDVEGWNWTPNFCPNCGARMKGVDDE